MPSGRSAESTTSTSPSSADDCHWAFYDRSPTSSGCWCSMAVCGSRAKSRAYRRRAASRS
ncbi:MAG TPA: CGNR zinc finger domain-containing protein [Streptosporangiaceae bacterium]